MSELCQPCQARLDTLSEMLFRDRRGDPRWSNNHATPQLATSRGYPVFTS